MGFGSQFANFARRTVGLAEKTYAPGPGGDGTGNWMSLDRSAYGIVAEPYSGAWQQNVVAACSPGLNIYANSAVYTCTHVISSDIAKLPLQILRLDPVTGIKVPHPNHPANALFLNPNAYQTTLQFVQQYITSKLMAGNTYVYLVFDARNVVTEMHVLDPRCVQPLIADDGSVFYRLSHNAMADLPDGVTVPSRYILHDRCLGLAHPLVGTGPMFAGAMSAMISGRIQMSSEQFFANMARTSGVLTAPGKLDPNVAKAMQLQWDQNYSGRGLGKTAVLTNGIDYKPMTVNATDSAAVDQLRWTVEDIARVFQVPPHRIGEMNKATYRNSEQMAREYLNNCIGYHISAFESCFDKALGLANDVFIEFDLTDLLRMEADSRYAVYTLGLNAGFLTINEVRARENMQPVPGGDKPRVQMQSVPLDMADELAAATIADKKTPAPAPAAPAPAKQLEAERQEQLGFDLNPDPVQMDLLVAAFGEHFDLGEDNGA